MGFQDFHGEMRSREWNRLQKQVRSVQGAVLEIVASHQAFVSDALQLLDPVALLRIGR